MKRIEFDTYPCQRQGKWRGCWWARMEERFNSYFLFIGGVTLAQRKWIDDWYKSHLWMRFPPFLIWIPGFYCADRMFKFHDAGKEGDWIHSELENRNGRVKNKDISFFGQGGKHDTQTTNKTRILNHSILRVRSHINLNELYRLVFHFLVCALLHRVLHVLLQEVVEKRNGVQALSRMKRSIQLYISRSSLLSFILTLSSSIFCMISFILFYTSRIHNVITSWRESSASITGFLSTLLHLTSVETRFQLFSQISHLLLFHVQLLLVLWHEALMNYKYRHAVCVRVVAAINNPVNPHVTISWMRVWSVRKRTSLYSSSVSKLSTHNATASHTPRTTGPFNNPSMHHT